MASKKFYIKVRAEGISWQFKATKEGNFTLEELMQKINEIFEPISKTKKKSSKD